MTNRTSSPAGSRRWPLTLVFLARLSVQQGCVVRRHLCKPRISSSRLRGIDAPELDTPEGQTAKGFVEAQLRKSVGLLVTTTKPDKWDRYLADVFLRPADGEVVYLNNLLLTEGHARRCDKVVLADWDAT